MKTKKQFILDTLLIYKEDNSKCAINEGGYTCLYLAPNGNKCAVGQHLIDGEWQQSSVTVKTLLSNYDTNILTEEAQEQNLSLEEWAIMQRYHDNVAYKAYKHVALTIYELEVETGLDFPELKF